METLFLKLANLSITASWLVLAVLFMRLFFRKAPKWVCCLLWALVALRLVCPISIESALSLVPSAEPLPRDILYTAVPKIQSGVGAIDDFVNPVLSDSMSPALGDSANPTQIWSFILTRIWAVGVAGMLLYALISYLFLRRCVATATLLCENIKQSENVDPPFVLGVFRPVIYLPYSVPDADITYVIAHEKAHIRRKDHWWKSVGFVLLAVYWFNPLLWLAYVLLCRDIEAACDEKVIREMEKEDRRAYSAALLHCSVRRRVIAACPLAFGEIGVKGRIKDVMNYKKPAFWIVLLAVVATIAVAVCLLTVPKRDTYNIKIVVPAGSEEAFVYSDEEISPTRKEITVWAGENLGDTEVILKPMEVKQENAYDQAAYLTLGMPTKLTAEKGGWFKIGINMQNPTDEDIVVTVRVEHIQVRIASETAPEGVDVQTESILLTPGMTYVSWQCLYMNPLSSYISNDSGYRYEIGNDFFSIIRLPWGTDVSEVSVGREIGSADVSGVYVRREMEGADDSDSSTGGEVDNGDRYLTEKVRVSKWEWQEFPYTEEEWGALFWPESSAPISDIYALYREIFYQPLDDLRFLLLADGDLLVVELKNNVQVGEYIWSIYSLINEADMGVAQWEYAPELSSRLPAFRFAFDMEYAEISAICTNGKLIDFDSQSASHAAPSDTVLIFPKGNALYWSPMKESDEIWQAFDSAIYFNCTRENGSQFSGTIYISAGGSSNGRTIYTATLVGTGLHLSPNAETEGGVISLLTTEAEPAVTEYDLRGGEIELSPAELSQYVFFTNSTRIVVTVKCDDDFEDTVILRDISQNNAEIQRKDVNNKDCKAVFAGLTSRRLYRIEYDDVENCTIVVSPK